MIVRPALSSDIPVLQKILDETGLFPSEMLPQMMDSFLTDAPSEDLWLSCEHDSKIVGFCYATPEALTDGAWNMLAIAVEPSMQGNGLGAALVSQLESDLRARGTRILIVDTSGSQAFQATRGFYRKNGYSEEARIRDFWAEGDDKIIFRKSLRN